ncbi:hypothetical protein BJY04DRAFT_219751 [Aspergillus karnatakaensis]|uniref:uncharacterized protein n=1 Tax=Aspergillus karnatakaensis TaxID=1810916 RepID=UPI003CCE004E
MAEPSDTPFLTKLPIELRYQIYELVFLNNKVNVFSGGEKLKLQHYLCPARGERYHSIPWIVGNQEPRGCKHRNDYTTTSSLSILRTCPQIYTEAVFLLWSQTTVHIQLFDDPLNFITPLLLRSVIGEKSFQAIRSLEVSFLHSAVVRMQVLDVNWFMRWIAMWKVIKRMAGLVHLQVWIGMEQLIGGIRVTEEQEDLLFTPLLELHHVPDYNVEVTWPANEGSEALIDGAPFQLTRNPDARSKSEVFAFQISNGMPMCDALARAMEPIETARGWAVFFGTEQG